MNKSIFTVPPTNEMGSYKSNATGSLLETMRQNALDDYNRARAHDGLPPLVRMPAGTRYEKLKPTITLSEQHALFLSDGMIIFEDKARELWDNGGADWSQAAYLAMANRVMGDPANPTPSTP